MSNEVITPPANTDAASVRVPPPATGYRRFRLNATLTLKLACPYCGGKLTACVNASEDAEEGGGMIATDLDIDCDTEPDIDGPEWEGWWADHSHDDCEKWHALHERVVVSMRKCIRFDFDNAPQ